MGTTGHSVGRETVGKGADSGTGNSRDGNKKPYDGMVDGGNRNQRQEGSANRGRERKITRFPVSVPSRSCPDHFFPCRLLPRVSLTFTKFVKINGEYFVSASDVKCIL